MATTDYSDCTFDELCNLHDDAVNCEDYAWADRIKAILSARPEYPAYQEKIAKLMREFQTPQSAQTEPPF